MPAVSPRVRTRPRLSPAADILRYAGKVPYVWGGGNPSGWDCSGCVNWVLGHDLGLTLPGGLKNFDGSFHGPVVLDYVAWGGAVTVPSPQAGDLCIWPEVGGAGGHIGIAISTTRMCSALDPALGTAVTPIAGVGPGGVSVMFRRVTGTTTGPGGGGFPWWLFGLPFALGPYAAREAYRALTSAAALVGLAVAGLGAAAVAGVAVAAGTGMAVLLVLAGRSLRQEQ